MRKQVSKALETKVLLASGRRCCLCVFLNGVDEVRKGQIAHVNHDPGDTRFKNLVWLCLDHHDEYDGRTSQSKGLTPGEITAYRDRLYERRPGALRQLQGESDHGDVTELEPLPHVSMFERLRRDFPAETSFAGNAWHYPLWQVANQPDLFAYKASNGADGVCLVERIDLPDGRIVVACISIVGNPGQSITNAVEAICFQVCERFEIPADRLVWLEHYEDLLGYDEWQWVTFEQMPPASPFRNPMWQTMTPLLWQQLGLRPRAELVQQDGYYESMLDKDFPWPDDAMM